MRTGKRNRRRPLYVITMLIGGSALLGSCGLLNPPDNAPSDLTAHPGAGQVTLEWLDNSTDESSFEVFRAVGGGIFWPRAETRSNATTWTDQDVEPGVDYRYQVRARFGEEPSFGGAFSNIVSYRWQGIEEADEPDAHAAVSVALDGVRSTVAVSNELFAASTVNLSVSSTAQPLGLRADMRLVAPGVTFSVPKIELDLEAPAGSFLVFPRWVAEEASHGYVWVTIATRGEPAAFALPYDPAHPDEPIEIHATWLAEIDDAFGLGSVVTIGVFPVAQTESLPAGSVSPQVVNQDFGLFKLDVADVANDRDLEEKCDANRAVFATGRVGRHGDPQEIGDRIPLVLVHGWQTLGNHLAGANPFDNFFRESRFAPHVCTWLDFIETYWILGGGALYDLASNYAVYTFSYDSDKHIIENAIELDAYLESAFGDRPAVIVSHSMGGLVASTVMRMVDDDDPTPSIGNIISFGSPYRGTPALVCVEAATIDGVPVCSRARVASDAWTSLALTEVAGSLLRFGGTRDLAWEVGYGTYLQVCEQPSGPVDRVRCAARVEGIANPFLAELNATPPDPNAHHSIIGHLDAATGVCRTHRYLWAALDQGLECANVALHDLHGYATDGIVPMQSAFFSDPLAPDATGHVPYDAFAGVNHVELLTASGPLHGAMLLLRNLLRGEPVDGDLFLGGHTGPITSASFTPDGERIITTSEDATARVWDAATGDLSFVADAHTASVNAAVVWRDGTTIMTGSSDQWLRQWDASGQEIWSTDYGITIQSMDISPSGRYFAVGVGTLMMVVNPRPAVYLFDRDGDSAPMRLGISSLEGFYHDVMFSADGTLLVAALAGVTSGSANVWDTATGTVVLELEGTYAVRTVAISNDGSRALAVSTVQGDVAVWNVRTGELLYEFDPPSRINDAAFSPDGTTIMLAGDDGSVHLHTAATGDLIGSIPTGLAHATVASFSPDGTRILVGSEAGEVIAFAY